MAVHLHQWTAAFYLVACLLAWLGLGLRARWLERSAVAVLGVGAVTHLAAFSQLHNLEPPPPLTDLTVAVSFMACAGSFFFLALMLWLRLAGLAALVAPLAFASAFFAATHLPNAPAASFAGSGSLPHLHVLLAGAGLAFLGVSGLAGVFYLGEHRRLKSKRPVKLPLPSLEALDRVNRVSLLAGFPLLTLGVVTGMMWVETVHGALWSGTEHQTFSVIAWAVYAVLVAMRFGSSQGARQAAASAVGGFALLFFAVIGVGILA
jgi:ABC-type uncharacterized transport system permease subunit